MAMKPEIERIFKSAFAGQAVSAAWLRALWRSPSGDLADIFAAARVMTTQGDVQNFTCGIVNAKAGLCQENCAFCSQSAQHTAKVTAYPLIASDAMLRHAERLVNDGVDYMGMVTSGAAPTPKELAQLCEMAVRIKREMNIKLCASLGVLGVEQARDLAQAGFTSCHHNLETARSNYRAVCPSHSYEQRLQTIRNARAAGLRICSGGIFGVGETWEQRLEFSLELAEANVDSIPVNFLIPIPGTPLEGLSPPPAREALLILAILRFMHPRRDVIVCGGRSALGRLGSLLFMAGANGVMVGDYLTTRGLSREEDRELLQLAGLSHG